MQHPLRGQKVEQCRVERFGVFQLRPVANVRQAQVPGIGEARFQEIAAAAKRDCPLSKALAGVPVISLEAVLRD